MIVGWDDEIDAEDLYEHEEEDRTPTPMFGCACENPLVIDSICGSCISYLAEQERLAFKDKHGRLP